jgi:pseudoazurin
MKKVILLAAVIAAVFGGAARAAEHEVRMLNKGGAGTMVFEPAFIKAAVGDTVRFVVADKGHNAETIKGFLPKGAKTFKGKMSQDVVVTLEQEGLYGVKCAPHYAMGMVALIQAGQAADLEDARTVKLKGKAKSRFEPLFAEVVQ